MSEYRGTTVKDIDKFRGALRKEDVFTKVYKIPLVNMALKANGIDAVIDAKAPVILSISTEDEVAPARIVKTIGKEVKTISILSGVVDGKFMDKSQILALAELPSKQDMRAKLVGTMNAPVSGFVNVLAGNIRGLLNVLNAVASK
jgi:large subunit ribosomal protein L10